MTTEHEQVATDDIGGPGFDDSVFVGQARRWLVEQRRELRVGPEGGEVEVGVELLQQRHVPFEVELADPVVRDRQSPRARVGGKIEIVTLDCDQVVPVGSDDPERNVQTLGLFDGLIASDHAAVPINEDGTARPVLAERALKGRATAIGTAIGIVGIRLEINEPKRMTDGSCGHGQNLRLSGAIAPLNGQVWCRGGADPEQQAAAKKNDE